MVKCTVLILTYNSSDDILECLESVKNQKFEKVEFDYEIIVADNNSSDNTCQLVRENYPSVTLLKFEENHGASKGYNRALTHVSSEYVTYLNPDTTVHQKWLSRLIESIEKSNTFAAHSSIFEPGDDRYASAKPDSRVLNEELDIMKVTDITKTGYVTKQEFENVHRSFRTLTLHGASMIFKTSDLRSLDHQFEEALYLFADDIDMALRLNVLGENVRLVPDSIVYHHQHSLADPSPFTWMIKKHIWATSGRFTSFFKNMYFVEFLLSVPLLLLGGALNARELRIPTWKQLVYGIGGLGLSFISFMSFLLTISDIWEHRKKILDERETGKFWLLKHMVGDTPPRLSWGDG